MLLYFVIFHASHRREINSQLSTLNSQLLYVVTLTTVQDVRSYPCRSMESAIKLAERFIAGVSRQSQATADVTKPARAASDPSTINTQPSTALAVAA